MNMTRDRMHTIGWGMALTICIALTLALTLRVNAVKSQVRLAERQIAQVRQEKLFLETEFETRASQQQLKAFNDVDFGYTAPTAGQYLENERQLAALGKPRSPDAPDPIRVASADSMQNIRAQNIRAMPALISPFAGGAQAAEASVTKAGGDHDKGKKTKGAQAGEASDLSDRLAQRGAKIAGLRE